MSYRGWRACITGGILAYLCIIVTCKKHRRGETYGDLGDEILIDEPSITNRKNEIPRGDSNHKIEPRTISKNTFGRYVNPLFYREFSSAPYRRNPRPAKPNIRGKVNRIPPWTKKHIIPPWDKKNIIHRPNPAKPRIAPRPPQARGRVLPQPRRPVPANKKWFQPRYPAPRPKVAPRPPYNAAAAAAARAKVKHQVHIQVPPPKGPAKGVHAGFVLMPAKKKPKALAPPPPPPPAPRPVKVPNRFAEKEHIFVPLLSHNVASYHIDEIGNLIPDISDPRFFEPKAKPDCRIPMKRDKNCAPPTAVKANARPSRPRIPPQKPNVMARNPRLPPSQQVSRPRLPPPRQAVKKPAPPPQRPRGRILYFPQSKQTPRFQQPQRPNAPRPPARRPPARAPARPAAQRPRPAPRVKQYEVPQVSNKAYQYINQRTRPGANNGQQPQNPLLAYLQYHRSHPNANERGMPGPQSLKMDKRSIVTGLFCCLKHWNWTITADNRNRKILH